jgi:N-acetylglucosaminyl-diphospho-decaprenol L-rhamnosyltransferase
VAMPDTRASRVSLTVAVLTLNEERHLDDCLSSARKLTDRLRIIDSGSTDRTLEIAREHGAEISHHPFEGYADQRNAALDMIDTEWVLFLDADEVIPDDLAREMVRAIETAGEDLTGFWIPRDNRFGDRSLRGGGWWPDAQLRLMRADRARYDIAHQVHERVQITGRQRRLNAPLIHYNFDSFGEFRAVQRRYTDMLVEHYVSRGEFGRRRTVVGRPVREFWRRFVTLGGYLDGALGLLMALGMSWYEFQTWRRVRERVPGEVTATVVAAHSAVNLTDPDPSLDLSVIIVSYNTSDLLSNCLASIEAWFEASDTTGEVIVVDNASTDGTSAMLKRRFPSVRLITNGHNAGFAAANNQGMRWARGRHMLLLNPDTTVVADAFGALSSFLDKHPDAGIAGPRLRYPDGSTQSSRRRFPTRLTGFLESTLIQDYWSDNRVLRRYYMADTSDGERHDVDWLVGACLIVRREAIESAGLLDERYFMYSEEIEWCYRIKQHGWRVVYVPDATVVHHEGSSSVQNVPARQINFDSSKVLLYEQLHGKTTARTLHLFLLATYLFRIALEGVKGLIGHKRSLRQERVSMYWRVLAARIRGTGGT